MPPKILIKERPRFASLRERPGKTVLRPRTGKIIDRFTAVQESVTPPGPTFEPEYQAVLDRGTALGYTLPSAGQQVLQNALVIALKAAGIWTLLDVFYVFATDGDRDFAKINWKAPTLYQATEEGTPTFTADQGFAGAASSRLKTNWTPSLNGVNYTLNDAGIFNAILTDIGAATVADYGSRHTDGTTNRRILQNARDTVDRHSYNLNGANITTVGGSVTSSIGFWHQRRTTALGTGHIVYKDGALLDNSGATSTAMPDNQVSILAETSPAGGITSPSTRRQGCWGAGASLAGSELALYNIWNTYFTSL